MRSLIVLLYCLYAISVGVAAPPEAGGPSGKQDTGQKVADDPDSDSQPKRVLSVPWDLVASRVFSDDDQYTQICEAIARYENRELVTLVEKQGGDLNRTGTAGLSLLYWALIEDNLKAFEVLLKHGASPELRLTDKIQAPRGHVTQFRKGDSVLFTSIRLCKNDFLVKAIPYVDTNKHRDVHGQSLLHVAVFQAKHGDTLEAVEAILQHGGDPNERCKPYRNTLPYGFAGSFGLYDVCAILVKHGADLEQSVGPDYTAVVDAMLKRTPSLATAPDFQRLVEQLHLASERAEKQKLEQNGKTDSGTRQDKVTDH